MTQRSRSAPPKTALGARRGVLETTQKRPAVSSPEPAGSLERVTYPIARRLRILLTALTAVLLAAAAVFVATPAHAHDELVSTDPDADGTVEVLPDQLTLTFSGVLSTEPGATEVAVMDADGASLTDGEPEVAETTVTQPLMDAATGTITVQWKVVSSDGHPISGEYSFQVAEPQPTPTPTPTATTTESTPAPTQTVEPSPTETPAPASDVSPSVPWVIGGIIAIAIIAAVVYLVATRRRTPPSEPGSPESGPRSAGPTER